VARKPTKNPPKSKRQRFTPEYKLEAVRLSEEGTKSIAAVAADLGTRHTSCIGGAGSMRTGA
jgi:transposase-like protein